MSSLNLDNNTKGQVNNIITTNSKNGKPCNDSLAKGDVDGEDSEMNLFLSDESSGNYHEREMDEASGEASGETSNGSNSSNPKKSEGSISTTDLWFREFNQNTKELNNINFDDDDSETPYYVNSYKSHPKHPKPVSNQQSSITSRHLHQRVGIPPISKSPRRGNFLKKCSESSGSDSYRSVIDDLTLKNQKLRQKLRKLERVHSKSLHKEKLFEVRYYQMPREKRRELEEYLRKFAAQLPTPNSSSTQLTQDSTSPTKNVTTTNIDTSHIKASDKSKMKQVVRAIENVFTTKPSLGDHYLKDQEDADPKGYVYLNLLTNMAQLHTMNVTLPFIKQAIRTFSNYLELNDDGTKVRWRTGLDHQFTNNLDNIRSGGSSEISCSTGDKQSDSSPFEQIQNYSLNQKNTYITPPSLTSSNASKLNNNQQIKSTPSITHYRPVFLHRNVSSSSSSSDETSSEIDQHDGPVIYYEGGLFCTDFSRDVVKDDDDKPTTSSVSQSLPGLDNSTTDYSNIDIYKDNCNISRYERATNYILGGNNIILDEMNETSEEDSNDGQEVESFYCTNDHDLPMSADDPKIQMIAVDDRNENSMDVNDGLNKILMEKDIVFNLDRANSSGKDYSEINDWNDNVTKNSSSSSPPTCDNSREYLPNYKKLHTTKIPGIITEDNFMVLVQTSHPPREKIFHYKGSSADSDENLMNSSSNSSTDMEQQKNDKLQQSSVSSKVISTKLFQLPPSLSPQPRTSPPPGIRNNLFVTSSKTPSSDSDGSPSGYGSSSSCSNTFSESSSATSRDNSYLLRNNTLLQLSRSDNSNLKSSQYDEVQDMELDSLSSDSTDPSLFINIDEDDEDEELEIKKDENHNNKSRIEESKLGMSLRLQDAAVEERRKLADRVAPQEQRFILLKNIMASSRATIKALENKRSNNGIDYGMDMLPTLPFFQQPNLGIGISKNKQKQKQ